MFHMYVAHAGEEHTSAFANHIHALGWQIQLPLFILLVAVFAASIWLLTKKVDTTTLITSLGLLLSGFLLFQVAPLVSVLAITVGLMATLGVTLLGLGAGSS